MAATEKGKKDDKSTAGTSVPNSSAASSAASSATEPTKREAQGFLMYLKGAIASKDADKPKLASSSRDTKNSLSNPMQRGR